MTTLMGVMDTAILVGMIIVSVVIFIASRVDETVIAFCQKNLHINHDSDLLASHMKTQFKEYFEIELN